jgi:hypothetical protein
MLSHWHYYKRDIDPLDDNFDSIGRHKSWISDLTPDQSSLVIGTWREMDTWRHSSKFTGRPDRT